MDPSLFDRLESRGANRCVLWSDPDCGLRAILVMDELSLGFAAGGTRTMAYANLDAAVEDAIALAHAMTIKLALGGLAVGGAKLVVMDCPELDRPVAFARLGQLIEELGGVFRTAGDMGTTRTDLEIMARHCQYVTTDEDLGARTARTVVLAMEACAELAGTPGLSGLRVAVQGCGAIGAAVARALAGAGVELMIADIDAERAHTVARETSARVIDAGAVMEAKCDILAPCAMGRAITETSADQVRAWAVCGAANNIMASAAAERRLIERGILYVPDVVASAGAVIHGVSRDYLHIDNSDALIEAMGQTARIIVETSRRTNALPTDVARQHARARISAGRALRRPMR